MKYVAVHDLNVSFYVLLVCGGKDLAKMQIEAKGQELQREISSEASRLGGVAYDPEEQAVEERKSLVAKKKGEEASSSSGASSVPIKKIALIVGATALAAILLLLLLFWRGSGTSPLEQSIEEESKAGSIPVGKDGCPAIDAIPKPCQTRDRLKNMSVFDRCSALFEQNGWEVKTLKSCGLIA